MTTIHKVLIVGGGIAGMSLAIRLQRQGVQTEIVERKTDWTVLGVGLILQGPAVRALQAVGILDRGLQEGFGSNELLIGGAQGHVFARLRSRKTQTRSRWSSPTERGTAMTW